MKKILFALTVGAALGLTACSLDEYNPNSIDESKMSNFEGLRATQAYCYAPLYGQMCDKEDFIFLTEGGSDLWNNINVKLEPGNGYACEVISYDGLVPAADNKGWTKVFQQAYSSLALCNMAIEKAKEVTDGQGDDVAVLVAETRFLRAYYHLLLTTHYGPITLVLSAPTEKPDLLPKRNTLTEIYTSITEDLKAAYADLKDTPFQGNRQRPTKVSALGLLARAYVQGAGQGLKDETGKSYWTLARETAEQVIAAYPDRWYNDIKEVWHEKNNRNNKEALFVAAGPNPLNMDKDAFDRSYKNENKLFRQTIFDFRNAAVYLDDNGKTLYWNNSLRNYVNGGQPNESIAPSKYFIDCFNPDWDRRWEYTFQTAFGGWTIPYLGWDPTLTDYEGASFTWSKRLCALYGVDEQHIGKTIHPYFNLGDDPTTIPVVNGANQYAAYVWPRNAQGLKSELIDPMTTTGSGLVIDPKEVFDVNEDRIFLYLSKKYMTAEEKKPYPFAIVNIDDLFTDNGSRYWASDELTDKNSGNIFVNMAYDGTNNGDRLGKVRPVLIKFNQTSIGMTGNNQQVKTADIFLLRMAEMYLIAAECYATEGNGAKAAELLNVLRQRALRPGYTGSDWRLSSATMDDVYDEYARELGGEFSRWALLQRHNAFKERLQKYNKRAFQYYTDRNYWRPISLPFLQSIDNAEEYGDNGYGTTASSGLDGFLE